METARFGRDFQLTLLVRVLHMVHKVIMNTKELNLNSIGNSLLEHSSEADFTARGVVEDLFPFIVQASRRMSTRAISQFLQQKHEVKLSYVTIGRALRDPNKYWNIYYDQIEQAAWTVAKHHGKLVKEFITEPEKYQEMLETKPVYVVDLSKFPDEAQAVMFAEAEYLDAQRILDGKWFCFDEDILGEARLYLIQRFAVKPSELSEDESNEEES
jgi:hypothetical protein